MPVGRFLGGVAALIWDPVTDRYLILRRAAQRDFQAGAWECVTGRVDQGESFEQALHREVMEEINAHIQVEFIIATTHFYRGQPNPDNELLGVIYGCSIANPGEVKFGAEHSEMRWVSAEEAYYFFNKTHWLHKCIQRSELLRKLLPDALREEFLDSGFQF